MCPVHFPFMYVTCPVLFMSSKSPVPWLSSVTRRYELHQWVYIIQHALEDFHKRHSQAQKPPSKPRPVSSGGTPTHKTSPRVKPSRPAPPAPKVLTVCACVRSA